MNSLTNFITSYGAPPADCVSYSTSVVFTTSTIYETATAPAPTPYSPVPTASTDLPPTHTPMPSADPVWVTITMDGQTVSWINNYTPDAPTPTTTDSFPDSSPSSSSDAVTPSAAPASTDISSSTMGSATAVVPSYASVPVASSAPAPSAFTSSTLSTAISGGTPTSYPHASFSTTSSAAAATPTVCGESGNFTLGWDDEPSFTPSSANTSASVTYAPVFNPYHHMFFSNGYAYAPPPSGPYPPISPSRLAIFLPNASAISDTTGSPNAGGERPGELGAGPRASLNAFWFTAYSAYLGCGNAGSEPCSMQISGYSWNGTGESLVAQQTASLPACPGLVNCTLTNVEFDPSFQTGLTGLQFAAMVGGVMQVFYMDSLSMGWYNNTCAAGLRRQMSRR